jgi:hypothetical protein
LVESKLSPKATSNKLIIKQKPRGRYDDTNNDQTKELFIQKASNLIKKLCIKINKKDKYAPIFNFQLSFRHKIYNNN